MKSAQFSLIFRHYIRRMIRGWFGLFIFIVLPVVIAALISFIYSQNTTENIYANGFNMVSTRISIYMMLLFQLNGGIYLLDFLNHDLFKPMKWRLKASPCQTHTLIYAGTVACTVFTTLQGLLIIAASTLLLDAYWGNLWVTILVVIFISLISQLMNMLLFVLVRNVSAAESLSWLIASIMAMLGGVMFSLPDNAFFRFMKEYGTPYSLAQSAILESGFPGTSETGVWVYLTGLFGIVVLLCMLAVPIGRRKLL